MSVWAVIATVVSTTGLASAQVYPVAPNFHTLLAHTRVRNGYFGYRLKVYAVFRIVRHG